MHYAQCKLVLALIFIAGFSWYGNSRVSLPEPETNMTPYVPPTQQLVVEVYVRNLPRSKAFYLQLGFDLLSEKESFVTLVWEDHRLFLEERKDISTPADYPQANVRIMVADVDERWRRVCAMKARVIKPIGDREYGLRDFTIADPDGFGLRFGSWLGQTSEERDD